MFGGLEFKELREMVETVLQQQDQFSGCRPRRQDPTPTDEPVPPVPPGDMQRRFRQES